MTAPQNNNEKQLATLQARAGLAGFSCCNIPAGNVVMSRFGGSWIFDMIELATGWLGRMQKVSP